MFDNMHVEQMIAQERQSWELSEQVLRNHIENAFHWQECAESYDQLVREYYQQRHKHQQAMVRLNQVLYHQPIRQAMQAPTPQPQQPGEPLTAAPACAFPARQPLGQHVQSVNTALQGPADMDHSMCSVSRKRSWEAAEQNRKRPCY